MCGTELSRVHSGRTVRWLRGTRASQPSSRLCDVATAWRLWDKSREPGRTKGPGGRLGSDGLCCRAGTGLWVLRGDHPVSTNQAWGREDADHKQAAQASPAPHMDSTPRVLACFSSEPYCQNLRGSHVRVGTLHPHRPALLLPEARPLAGCPKWEACAPPRPWDGDAAGSDPDSTLTGPASSGSNNPGQCGRSLLRG